jgi:hypothetical protein
VSGRTNLSPNLQIPPHQENNLGREVASNRNCHRIAQETLKQGDICIWIVIFVKYFLWSKKSSKDTLTSIPTMQMQVRPLITSFSAISVISTVGRKKNLFLSTKIQPWGGIKKRE